MKTAGGIILYRKDFSIACYPFDKFNNYDSGYAHKIDWVSVRVEEKIDGSLMKIWWNFLTNEWVLSTNGTIFAEKAKNYKGLSFKEIFEKAESKVNYNHCGRENPRFQP